MQKTLLKELVLGCGHNPRKLFTTPLSSDTNFQNSHTCDINPECNPDTVWDLNILPWPWDDNSFDEIHAYNILEHLGQQGDYKSFFAHFDEMHRILKPTGFICGITIDFDSKHLWGDPGHTRAITKLMVSTFLDRDQYKEQCGKTAMTDYRFCYKGDFESIAESIIGNKKDHEDSFAFLLKTHKPIRI